MGSAVLALRNITKTYPGVAALCGVSISFEKGEVHAVMGENGAGKSTLIKVISGAAQPDSGEIVIDGAVHARMTPQLAIEKGVSVIYQEFNLFDSLTAAENIFIGERPSDRPFVDYREMAKRAESIFARFNVKINPNAQVNSLTPAYKQIIEISKTIHKNAKILIMDEPTAPLSVDEVNKLFEIIAELKANGITIIYISHRLDEIFAIADRVSVLRDGRHIDTRRVSELDRNKLIQLMVGRELTNTYPRPVESTGETVLAVNHMSGNFIRDVSFRLNRGEILGFAGLVGSGRTELMRLVFGADKRESGEILINGSPVRITTPTRALKLGIGLIPEDRKRSGVFLNNTVAWNICISSLHKISKNKVLGKRLEEEQAEFYHEKLKIKTPSLDQKVINLSGGNQQKVALAKVLAADTEVLIFDEPTRGIDVGARMEIYRIMRELSAQGKGIIMVSSDMEELLGMSDRIVVMAEGRQAGVLEKAEFDQERILALASGN